MHRWPIKAASCRVRKVLLGWVITLKGKNYMLNVQVLEGISLEILPRQVHRPKHRWVCIRLSNFIREPYMHWLVLHWYSRRHTIHISQSSAYYCRWKEQLGQMAQGVCLLLQGHHYKVEMLLHRADSTVQGQSQHKGPVSIQDLRLHRLSPEHHLWAQNQRQLSHSQIKTKVSSLDKMEAQKALLLGNISNNCKLLSQHSSIICQRWKTHTGNSCPVHLHHHLPSWPLKSLTLWRKFCQRQCQNEEVNRCQTVLQQAWTHPQQMQWLEP